MNSEARAPTPKYRTPEGWRECRTTCFAMYRIFRAAGSSRERVRDVIGPILDFLGPDPPFLRGEAEGTR